MKFQCQCQCTHEPPQRCGMQSLYMHLSISVTFQTGRHSTRQPITDEWTLSAFCWSTGQTYTPRGTTRPRLSLMQCTAATMRCVVFATQGSPWQPSLSVLGYTRIYCWSVGSLIHTVHLVLAFDHIQLMMAITAKAFCAIDHFLLCYHCKVSARCV